MWVTKMSLGVMKDHIQLMEERLLEAKTNLYKAKKKLYELQESCIHEHVNVRTIDLPFVHKHVSCLDCGLSAYYHKDREGYADPAQHMRGWHE